MTRSKLSLNQSGQGLTEYLILLFLVAVASIVVVKQMGATIKERFEHSKESIVRNLELK